MYATNNKRHFSLVSLLHKSQRQGIFNVVNLTKGNRTGVITFCAL